MEILQHHDGRYIARTVYREKNQCKENSMIWDGKEKFWYAPDLDVAYRMRGFAKPELRDKIEKEYSSRQVAIQSSRATDSDLEIPLPEGKSLLPFQKAGVEFMKDKSSTLLADEMGCISGDATIILVADGQRHHITIKDAYQKYTNNKNCYTNSLFSHQSFRINHVRAIKYSGIKDVISVKTTNGKSICLTPDHEVRLSNGRWIEAQDLNPDDWITTESQSGVSSSKVVSIEPAGQQETYDLVMADPGRNFVANGIVVHNCGKTVQAIGIMNLDQSAEKILVICPASLRLNWKKEILAWTTKNLEVTVMESKVTFPYNPGIVIINYDILPRYAKELRQHTWDILICDEAHYIKNHKAKRTQQVIGKKKAYSRGVYEIEPIKANRKLMLTGTPILNTPAELWALLSYLDPETWGTYDAFTKRYCGAKMGKFGWDVSGSRNLDELQGKLRETVMVRRLKKDVLKDLPPKLRQVIELPQNGASQAIKAENEAYQTHEDMIRELRVATELAKVAYNEEGYRAAVARLRSGVRIAFNDLAKARKETAIAKVPYVIAHCRDASEKVVLFGHHIEPLKMYAEAFGDEAVMLIGETSIEDRNAAVEAFQNDPNIKYFIGSIKAAGVGLTLTASSHVVFSELDWTPASVSQAEDRCHRLGTVNSVLVQHLVFDDSVDCKIANSLVVKQAVIEDALDTLSDFPLIPDDGDPASTILSYQAVEEAAVSITSSTAEAILSACRHFVGLVKQSDMNCYDYDIIVKMSQKTSLTAKEAVLTRAILISYDVLPEAIKENLKD